MYRQIAQCGHYKENILMRLTAVEEEFLILEFIKNSYALAEGKQQLAKGD